MNYFLAAVLIGFAILFHEFGHFIAAKKAGVPVAVFSIGLGPKLISRKWNGTEYRLSLIPLGGYVMPDIENDDEFFKLPVNKRIFMAIGGPIASFVLPVFCLSIMFTMSYGFSLSNIFYKPIMQSVNIFNQMALSIPQIFSHSDQLSGIVGIVNYGGEFLRGGFINILQFTAMMSMNFAVLNLIPIPVLDGGKILLYLLEKINPKLLKLHFPLAIAGWAFMIGLMVYVTASDIGNLFATGNSLIC
jgi:regulator of sigma E protease